MKEKSKVPEFQSRWVIRGSLTTEGPLHVGDGGEAYVVNRARAKGNDESDASTVCADHRGRACIPGSAIKGALRARVKTAHGGKLPREWETLLGSEQADEMDAEGGVVEFSDALIPSGAQPPTFDKIQNATPRSSYDVQGGAPAYWQDERFTGVAVSVSLDRRTRTAKESLLYSLEYVPANVSFDFELTGENISDSDVARLLSLLDCFNRRSEQTENGAGKQERDHDRVTLGAQASNSWGLVEWKLTEVRCFTAKELRASLPRWLNGTEPLPGVGYSLCRRIDHVGIEEQKRPLPGKRNILVFDITLNFQGPLLVRDPQQSQRVKNAKEKNAEEDQKPPDATPILDERGYPMIPAKAARGVLRSQVERILRTMNLPAVEPSGIKPVTDPKAVIDLDLAAQLFGASGWRAPLEVNPFIWADVNKKPQWLDQEFVAIDRFTGGAAEGRKFNARAALNPNLIGKLTIDLDRIADLPACNTARGLIALLLRDLLEGDLVFGSKSSIGYGQCIATVNVEDPLWTWSEKQNFGTASYEVAQWFRSGAVTESLKKLRNGASAAAQPSPEKSNV